VFVSHMIAFMVNDRKRFFTTFGGWAGPFHPIQLFGLRIPAQAGHDSCDLGQPVITG
jgi:hypothetical protein